MTWECKSRSPAAKESPRKNIQSQMTFLQRSKCPLVHRGLDESHRHGQCFCAHHPEGVLVQLRKHLLFLKHPSVSGKANGSKISKQAWCRAVSLGQCPLHSELLTQLYMAASVSEQGFHPWPLKGCWPRKSQPTFASVVNIIEGTFSRLALVLSIWSHWHLFFPSPWKL